MPNSTELGYIMQPPLDESFGASVEFQQGTWHEYTYWADFEPTEPRVEVDGQQPMPLKRRFIDFDQIDEDDHEAQVFALIEDAQFAAAALRAELEQSENDELTGLLRRGPFEQEFERLVIEQQKVTDIMRVDPSKLRRGDREKLGLAILYLDLDGFKEINDTMGHAMGDYVLREVAVRLEEATRTHDHLCRLGGDEFVVLLNAGVQEENIARFVERIRGDIMDIEVAGQRGRVGASIGYSVFVDGMQADEMLQEADAGMYVDKQLKHERMG